jgi:hypothetical protein
MLSIQAMNRHAHLFVNACHIIDGSGTSAAPDCVPPQGWHDEGILSYPANPVPP